MTCRHRQLPSYIYPNSPHTTMSPWGLPPGGVRKSRQWRVVSGGSSAEDRQRGATYLGYSDHEEGTPIPIEFFAPSRMVSSKSFAYMWLQRVISPLYLCAYKYLCMLMQLHCPTIKKTMPLRVSHLWCMSL